MGKVTVGYNNKTESEACCWENLCTLELVDIERKVPIEYSLPIEYTLPLTITTVPIMHDTLHKFLFDKQWREAEKTLSTLAGKEMARQEYQGELPLHLAIELRAPDSLIVAILEAHLDGASVLGREGQFPIHMAAQKNVGAKVVVDLIRAYPEALDKQDDNGRLPSDYPQRSDLCREALARPSVCWIEDIEKEDYLSRVEERRNLLRQKLVKLRTALDGSKARSERIKSILRKIEPRLEEQQRARQATGSTKHQIKELEESTKAFLDDVRSRVKAIGEDIDETDEEIRAKVVKKRAFMQGVQKQYEKLLTKTDQIQVDLQAIKVLLPTSHAEILPTLSKSRSFA